MATMQEIEHVLKLAAKVVALYGDAYLPTFQRLHREFQMAKDNQDQKTLALKIAMQYVE